MADTNIAECKVKWRFEILLEVLNPYTPYIPIVPEHNVRAINIIQAVLPRKSNGQPKSGHEPFTYYTPASYSPMTH
jgi:hypothetical protein